MNKVIVSGYVSKEVKPNPTNKMANAGLAVARPYPFNRGTDGKPATDFLTLKFIGEKNVTRAAQWLAVGTSIVVEGIVCCDTWKDAEGKWQKFDYILVQAWEFQKAKRDNSTSDSEGVKEGVIPAEVNYDPPKEPDEEGFMDIPDGIEKDLPFR